MFRFNNYLTPSNKVAIYWNLKKKETLNHVLTKKNPFCVALFYILRKDKPKALEQRYTVCQPIGWYGV